MGWIQGIITTVIYGGFTYLISQNWWVVSIGGVVMFLVGTVLGARLKSRVDYFENRMIAPSVLIDIKKAGEVWVAWHTATVISIEGQLGEQGLGHKLTKVILLSPDGNYLPIHAKTNLGISSEKLRLDIKTAKTRLQNEGVKEVRYFDGFTSILVICNPTDDKRGWIRMETWNPFLQTGSRPIFYIYAKKHPASFRRLRDSYEKTWQESK